MATIQKHYDIELAKAKPNQLLLDEISKVLERKTLTLSGWRLSAKFIPRDQFLADNPTEELLDNCHEVIEYLGKHYIQVLKSGTFRYAPSIRSKVLDEIENKVWNKISESLWCEEC